MQIDETPKTGIWWQLDSPQNMDCSVFTESMHEITLESKHLGVLFDRELKNEGDLLFEWEKPEFEDYEEYTKG